MIKGSTYQEDKIILNMHISNKRASKYMKPKNDRAERRNRQMHCYSWDLQLLPIDQKISNGISEQNNEPPKRDVYINTPSTVEYTFLSSVHKTLVEIAYVMGH